LSSRCRALSLAKTPLIRYHRLLVKSILNKDRKRLTRMENESRSKRLESTVETSRHSKSGSQIHAKLSLPDLITQSQRFDLLILLAISLIVRTIVARSVLQPSYADAAYYFDVAKNLATGHGFLEDFIYTYLTPAKSVIHPSNFYWMPLTSIIMAPFLALFGTSWQVAQIPMILLSATLPLLAYWIGWDLFQSRRYALAMALFMVFEGPLYSLYFATTDCFALYSWVGLLALIAMYQGWRGHPWCFALAGIPIGLAHLTRADGELLLIVGVLVWLCSHKVKDGKGNPLWTSNHHSKLHPIPWQALLGMFICYLWTMAPWFLRNIALIGSPLPNWGTMTIWLTSYEDFFSFHKILSPQAYFSWGLANIFGSKLIALAFNLLMLFGAVYIPLPFAILGMWIERKRAELLPFLIYLILLYTILALVFTFPTMHGSFFHSLTAVLPILHGWSIVGMDATIDYISNWFSKVQKNPKGGKYSSLAKGLASFFGPRAPKQSEKDHQLSPKEKDLMCLSIAILAAIVVLVETILTIAPAWRHDNLLYQQVGQVVASDYRAQSVVPTRNQPIVMVADAADYYYATDQHAVLLPTQNLATILEAAQSHSVSYILFTPNQGTEERQLEQTTLTDSRLKLIWASPSGKLYRFLLG
jgi:4-amino-4-deoxy-L-arabinose transferase-like glycosyltransferase